ncbi:uncharacterized protein [Periplaneta americana]|uniref:uncharacterized protein n=1 Tax=Periplaneta americana TaxID=6978 RepID=UPI0037E945A9
MGTITYIFSKLLVCLVLSVSGIDNFKDDDDFRSKRFTLDINFSGLGKFLGNFLGKINSFTSASISRIFEYVKFPSLSTVFTFFKGNIGDIFIKPGSRPKLLFNPFVDVLLRYGTSQNFYESAVVHHCRQFLNRPDLLAIIGSDLNISAFQNAGLLLKAIFERALTSEIVRKDINLYNSLLHCYKNLVFSGPPINAFQELTLDFDSIFRAFDLQKINMQNGVDSLKRLIHFLLTEFNFNDFLKQFKIHACYTRGDFLRAFLIHLYDHPKIPLHLKYDIQLLVPHVVTTGVGASPIDYVIASDNMSQSMACSACAAMGSNVFF